MDVRCRSLSSTAIRTRLVGQTAFTADVLRKEQIMNNITKSLMVLIAVVVATGLMVQGQAKLPYVGSANLTIYKIESDGSKVVDKSFTMLEARDVEGNRARKQTGEGIENSSIWKKSTGDLYIVDYKKHIKYLSAKLSAPPGVIDNYAGMPSKAAPRKDVVQGIPCLRLSRFSNSGSEASESGFTCISQEYDGLTIQMESPYEANGQKYLAVQKLTSLRMGEVPSPAWFVIPDDYREAKPTQAPKKP